MSIFLCMYMPWIWGFWDTIRGSDWSNWPKKGLTGWGVNPNMWKGACKDREGESQCETLQEGGADRTMVDSLSSGPGLWGRGIPPAVLFLCASSTAVHPSTQRKNTSQLLIFQRSLLLVLKATCPQGHHSVAGLHGAGGMGPLRKRDGCVGCLGTAREATADPTGQPWPFLSCAWSSSTTPLTSQRWTGPCWARRNVWTTVGACSGIPASSSQTWPSCPSSFSSGHTPWPWPWKSSNSAAISLPR